MSASQVTRPAVPLAAWCVIGLFVGIVGAERLSWHHAVTGAGLAPAYVALLATGLGLAGGSGLLVLVRRGAVRSSPPMLLPVVALCICVGLACGSVRWHGWHLSRTDLANPSHLLHSSATGTPAVVVRDPTENRFGWSVIVRPLDSTGVRVRVMFSADQAPPMLGQVVSITAPIAPVDTAEEWARRAHQRVEAGSASVRSLPASDWAHTPSGIAGPLRAAVTEHLGDVHGVGGDLLQGVLLGDRTRLRGTLAEEDLRVCGLSHLMAVSGTHLGIVALVVGRAMARARRGLKTRIVLVACAMAAYVALTGVQPSSLRALGMGSIAGLAALSGRRGDGLAALSVAAGAMLVWDPAVAFDIGFRLSVSAVAGLVVFASLAGAWARATLGSGRAARTVHPVADTCALTLVAQAATAPVAIPAFGMFSLIAPVANVVALPLLTVALVLGLVGALVGLALPGVAVPLLALAAFPLRMIAATAASLAQIPGAAPGAEPPAALLVALTLLPAVGLWAAWPIPRNRIAPRLAAVALLSALGIGMLGSSFSGGAAPLTVLDVGQGDAVLVRDGAATLLIDTGPEPDKLRSALTREGIRRLDALVLTHDHADHTGGVGGLLGMARAERVLGPVVADPEAFGHLSQTLRRITRHSAPDGSQLHYLAAGDVLTIGTHTRLEVLWPRAPDPALSTNDTSIVMHLVSEGFSALIAGDAEDVVWDRLADSGEVPDVDVVLAPHHGSANGITARALDLLTPDVVLISVGEDNDFGHPSSETLALLAERGIPVMRTDLHGVLKVYPAASGTVRVKSERGENGATPVANVCDNPR